MTARKKVQTVVKTEVTLGQLIGTALSLMIMIAVSYVNLQIKVSNSEVRQDNTDKSFIDIKEDVKEIKMDNKIILEKLGGLEARAEDQQRDDAARDKK